MKIKAKNPSVVSMRLCVPVDGAIDINELGIAEVTPKCATVLVRGTNDWDYLKGEEEKETEVEIEEGDREKFEAHLKTLKVDELKALAEEGEFPKEEWEKLNKKLLAAYLLSKFDEAAAEQDGEEDEEDEEEED